MIKFGDVVNHPVTRALGGALLALATLMVNDVRSNVAEQRQAMDSLKNEVREYKSTATTEDVKLSSRIEVLELKLQLATSELDKRMAIWDEYWAKFQPALQRWLDRQKRLNDEDRTGREPGPFSYR